MGETRLFTVRKAGAVWQVVFTAPSGWHTVVMSSHLTEDSAKAAADSNESLPQAGAARGAWGGR